ncbi:MAG: HAD-IC family P-type ATPase [Oligoflexales bacterium]|nr:HAD-IC family P-type ATPase [Oligoflexales bacterium]
MIEIDAKELVFGDVVLLESGQKVPADLRLFKTNGLEIDESLLTGESEAVSKNLVEPLPAETALGDRKNMAFTGSLITKGRASGLVVAAGSNTILGSIASSISTGEDSRPPLLIRMERFTKKIAIILLMVTALMALFLFYKGQGGHEVMMFSVAIAVSAIPEGLPVALTVALAIASRRMAKRNVIIRKLPAVEALGSCSFIATDKTGTLTVNQLTIKKIALPDSVELDVQSSGLSPKGKVLFSNSDELEGQKILAQDLVGAGVLCNESRLVRKDDGEWHGQGDAVDLALLVLAHKFGLDPEQHRMENRLLSQIPYEPELQYAASLHMGTDKLTLSFKGSVEKILPMCKQAASAKGTVPLFDEAIVEQADQLAESGYRVIAIATGQNANEHQSLNEQLHGLCFLGLVAMIDPLREEATGAIESCQQAGIDVAMITGDHPKTAYAIAKELKLTDSLDRVVTGPMLKAMPPSIDKEQL